MSRTVAVRVAWPLEQTGYSAMLHFIRATMHETLTEACKRPSDRPKGSFLWHRRCLRGMANDKLQLQRTLRTAQRTALRTLRTKLTAHRHRPFRRSYILTRTSQVSVAKSRFQTGGPTGSCISCAPTCSKIARTPIWVGQELTEVFERAHGIR